MDYQITELQKSENRDCSVRAVSWAAGINYDEVHQAFKLCGRESRRRTPKLVTYNAIKSLGFKLVNVTKQYDARTVKSLETEVTSRKILIVFVRGHMLCLRDGETKCWTSRRQHRVQQIFELERVRSEKMATATKEKKTTKKTVTKNAGHKGGTKGKGKKKGGKKATTSNNGLTSNQNKILSALKKTKYGQSELTRPQLTKSTGIKKGFARILGAVTVEGFGVAGTTSLESMGLVKSAKHEDSRLLSYSITEKGKKALDKK